MKTLPFALLAITDALRDTLEADVRAAVSAGGARVAVLLRDPTASDDAYERCARRLAPICADAGATFLAHGLARLPLAGEPGIHGIHLPERDATDGGLAARTRLGARALVGVSRHATSGLLDAAHADYATLAPVFAVPGKGPPLGVDALRAACGRSPLPVVALGGLTPARAAECRAAGAAAVAAMSYLWRGDVGENVRRMLEGGHEP